MGKTVFRTTKNRATAVVANDGSLNNTTDPVTFNVASGQGANFPSAFPFYVTVDNEILKVTNRVGDALTASRSQEGTTAAAHANGTAVELRVTAGMIDDITAAVNNIEDGKGNSVQTKSITATSDTIPNTTFVVKLNNSTAGSITLASTPTIAAGVDGQRLQLISVGTQAVVIQDRGTLAGSNLALTATSLSLTPRASVLLEYDSTIALWVQVGPLVTPL